MSQDKGQSPKGLPEPPPGAPGPKPPGTRSKGMLGGKIISLGVYRGVRFGVDPSWFFMFLFVTFSVADGFAQDHPEWAAPVVWLTAAAGTFLFFGSILLHEIGHCITSVSVGVPVRSITLYPFSGVAELAGEPKRPRDEFLIAIAGPAVSALLSLLFLVLWMAIGGGHPVEVVCGWLGLVNLAVALFNMLPGIPLDGGRVFRAVLWRVFEDYDRATQWAGRLGILLGNLMSAFGLVIAIAKGSLVPGFFLAFMGWFLARSARMSTLQALMASRLRNMRVKDAAKSDAPVVDAWDTLEEVLEQVPDVEQTGVLVHDGGVMVGALGGEDISATTPGKGAFYSARQIMTPLQRLVRVSPAESLLTALRLMEREKESQLLVDYGGEAFGLLSRSSLTKALSSR